MCEPLSIATGVASLFAASMKLTQSLIALQQRFERVPDAVQQLSNEFHLTSAGLGELESLLRSRQDVLSTASQGGQAKQHILQCVNATNITMARSFALLGSELEKLHSGDGAGSRSVSWRLRFMWVQKDLMVIMVQIRDQRSSLAFLMQIIQLAKVDDIQRKFQSPSPGLSALRRTATIAKDSRPSLVRRAPAQSQESVAPSLQDMLDQNTKFPDLDGMKSGQSAPSSPQASAGTAPSKTPQERWRSTSVPAPAPAPAPSPPPQGPPVPMETRPGSARPAGTRRSWPATPYAPSQRIAVEFVHHELHYAVGNNDLARLPVLMDAGQTPLGLPLNPYGTLPNANKTPLSLAAHLGREQVMQAFLDRGFGWALNECIGKDLPPLLAAAYAGEDSMLKMLLAANANPRLRGPGNNTAVFWAAARGHASSLELLLQHGAAGDVNFANEKCQTPLLAASQGGHEQAVRILLDHGADVHYQNLKLQSPIHLAAHGGHFATINMLISHKAQVNEPTSAGKTPLIFASSAGYFDAVDALVDAGAFINLQDAEGKTALYHAASLGHSEVVEVLLDRYASTEVVTKQGDRALHIAAEKGHARVVGLLLDHGARLEATRTEDGRSALGIAMHYHNREILGPLILFQTEQNPEVFSRQAALYAAAEWLLTDAMDALLESGADIDSVDGENQSLLSRAIRENKLETAALLIERGASVNLADKYGAMPLHRAARTSNTSLAQILVDAGADINGLDRSSQTPLQVAEVYGSPEIVELLRGLQPPPVPVELPDVSTISLSETDASPATPGTPAIELGDATADAPLLDKRSSEPVELPAVPVDEPPVELPAGALDDPPVELPGEDPGSTI